jgi:prephenate dehydratase
MNIKIAYQGEIGSFAYLALQKFLQKNNTDLNSVDLIATKHFYDIFNLVEKKQVAFGIIPIENSIAGSVLQNYDLLRTKQVFITNEVLLSIKHQLLGLVGSSLAQIKNVYSHPKALEQCQNFLNKNKLKTVEFENTALAAKFIKNSQNKSLAAIASKEAGQQFGLKILEKDIQDHTFNWTRFLIFEKAELENIWQIKGNKISIAYTLQRQKSGSLVNSLSLFSEKGFNLTNIECRPIVGRFFEYYFYLDVEYQSSQTPLLKDSLRKLKEVSQEIKILGVYEKGELD